MTLSHAGRQVVRSLLLISLFAVIGCGEKEIVITQFPVFWKGTIKTVAVTPFRNTTGVRGAGNVLSDNLSSQLATNGTYKVYNRNDLRVLQNEHDLRIGLGLDNAEIARKFRKVGKVDAVLIGTVTNYSATERRENRFQQDPIYQYNPKTKQTYIAGYRKRTFVFTRNEANVAVTAALVHVDDGTTVYATPAPARGNFWAQGSPPKLDKYACLNNATQQAVNKLVQTFAVTRRTIKVKEKDDFRTASELYDQEWTWTDQFKTSDGKGFLVVRLPAVCDRNRFRLTIIRKDTRKDLHEETIIWDKKYNRFGYAFKPSEVARKGGGPGEYVAKFYSGSKPVMKHEFRIE